MFNLEVFQVCIMMFGDKYSNDKTRQNWECQYIYGIIYLLTTEEEQPVLLRKNGIRTLASIAYDIFI